MRPAGSLARIGGWEAEALVMDVEVVTLTLGEVQLRVSGYCLHTSLDGAGTPSQ